MIKNFLHRESVNRILKTREWKQRPSVKKTDTTPVIEIPVEVKEPIKKNRKKNTPIEEINNNEEETVI